MSPNTYLDRETDTPSLNIIILSYKEISVLSKFIMWFGYRVQIGFA